jgi:hypothetical protein
MGKEFKTGFFRRGENIFFDKNVTLTAFLAIGYGIEICLM